MDLQEKKVLVFGAGISGIGSCGLLEKEGAEVILYDGNDKKDAEAMKAQLGEGSKVRVILGAFPEEEMESLDLVVMSPGVPTDLSVVLAMKEKGIPVWGEIELAYVCGKGDVLGITGTNGKTTTTSLLGEIMKNARDSVFVVGNIGTPYTNAAADTREDSVIVAELSSFQLESIHTFHPKVSAVLNITPDHLNRHHTMEAYIRAKMNIAKNQTPEDICVLNYEDEETRKMADEFQASVLFFSSKHKLEQGIYLDGEDIVYKPEKEKEGTVICKTGELQILGVHNYENVLNFTYYFNIFQPECVVVEAAEYTINPTYFNEENLKNFSLNPKLDELSAEQQEDLSVISPDIEEGQTLATVSVQLPQETEYAYLLCGDTVYDLLKEEDGYAASLEKEQFDRENISVITVDSQGQKIWYR